MTNSADLWKTQPTRERIKLVERHLRKVEVCMDGALAAGDSAKFWVAESSRTGARYPLVLVRRHARRAAYFAMKARDSMLELLDGREEF